MSKRPPNNDSLKVPVAASTWQWGMALAANAFPTCASGLAASTELYLALIYAMWLPGRFDVVNVSMSTQLVNKCETPLGLTIAAVADWCKANSRSMGPQLVTAAGNLPQKFGYPAAVDGAVIVEALDWQPALATYNTAVPQELRPGKPPVGNTRPAKPWDL